MRAKLFCRTGALSGLSFDLTGEATIGKNPGNTIQLTQEVVSGKHARIFFDQGRGAFFLEDLESRNGTWIDGVRVRGTARLNRLNVVSFAGSLDFIFQVVQSAPGPGERGTVESPSIRPAGKTTVDIEPMVLPVIPSVKGSEPERFPSTPPEKPVVMERVTEVDDSSVSAPSFQNTEEEKTPATRRVYALQVTVRGQQPQTFPLRQGENVVGRDASCAIAIRDSSISRRHAVLTVSGGSVTIRDLASKNKTFVENQPIESDVVLAEGARMRFGEVEARLEKKQ